MSGFRRRATTIKYKELWQHSLLSITFPIGDTELDFDMVAVFPEKKEDNKKDEGESLWQHQIMYFIGL